jgi:carbamate kinase
MQARLEAGRRFPAAKGIVELESVKAADQRGTVVITVGGGGIPVIDRRRRIRGHRRGHRQGLCLVACWRRRSARPVPDLHRGRKGCHQLRQARPEVARQNDAGGGEAYLAEGTHFAKGSMAPKIQAIIWFLENGGKQALITNPENIGRALKGETGETWIRPHP